LANALANARRHLIARLRSGRIDPPPAPELSLPERTAREGTALHVGPIVEVGDADGTGTGGRRCRRRRRSGRILKAPAVKFASGADRTGRVVPRSDVNELARAGGYTPTSR
jgi:hypothetical protein